MNFNFKSCEAKLKELEGHLEIGLKKFLELRKILEGFQQEIEYTDDSINGFIKVRKLRIWFIFDV